MRWKSGEKNSENESPDGCLSHLQAFAWSFDWGEIKPQKQEIDLNVTFGLEFSKGCPNGKKNETEQTLETILYPKKELNVPINY